MTHVTVSEAKGGSVINYSVEKEIGSLAWPGYSPPGLGFRTPEDRSGSVFSQREKKKNTSKRDSGAFDYPQGGVGDGGEREREAGLEGSKPVPIVATVQLHLSQQRRDYFYKAFCDSAGQTSETPALRKERNKKQRGKNSLEKNRKVFGFFSFSFGDTNPAP